MNTFIYFNTFSDGSMAGTPQKPWAFQIQSGTKQCGRPGLSAATVQDKPRPNGVNTYFLSLANKYLKSTSLCANVFSTLPDSSANQTIIILKLVTKRKKEV